PSPSTLSYTPLFRSLGRVDQQVKVRGFRVELPEIEAVLAQHPAVRQTAVALDRGDGDDARVVAYVVTDARHFEEAATEGSAAATDRKSTRLNSSHVK